MPLPSVTMVTVTEDYRLADGTAPTGWVRFAPSVRSTVSATTVTVEPVMAVLVGGQLSVSLAYQGDSHLTPRDWSYRVTELVGRTRRVFSVQLPSSGTVALHALAPVDPVVPGVVRVLTVEGIGPDVTGNIDLPDGGGGVTDHGALTGLADDDHPQYLNTVRGDARYVQPSALDAYATDAELASGLATKEPTGTAAAAVAAHEAASNPHPVYATDTDLSTGLAGKANAMHGHAISDVTGLSAGLVGKSDVGHAHVVADTTGLQTALDGKEAVGSAAAAVAAHVAASDPHPQYLTAAEGNAAYDPAGAASSAVAAHAAASDPHPVYLTQVEADALYASRSAAQATAARYGCKAITLSPHAISWATPQMIAMSGQRLYQYWLPVQAGTVLTGVRLPVETIGAGAGALRFAAYQDDLSQLASTADVASAFTTGSANTWRTAAFGATGTVTGAGVWVVALSTLATGPSVVFSNTSNLPAWTMNPSFGRTSLRTESVTVLPTTLNPSGGTDYIDFIIGVY